MKNCKKALTAAGHPLGKRTRLSSTASWLCATMLPLGLATTGFAQGQGAAVSSALGSSPGKNDVAAQLLDFSRPGRQHALLGTLAGNWAFQDARLPFVKGTLSRKPMYDGRFYKVEITGGKLPVPVADGKMKEENYQELQLEGYDNGRRQFVTTSVNNHIGSDIEQQSGTYDAAAKSFIYDWESELIPGMQKKNRRVLKVVDANHYSEEYYEDQNGKLAKVRQLDYTRVQ